VLVSPSTSGPRLPPHGSLPYPERLLRGDGQGRMEERWRIQLDLHRGDILAGKYRVDRVLGAGGMGIVIAAQHLGLGQKVAIKFLLPDALEDPEAAARFDREARAAARIKGEHIARVTDVGTLENGSPFMVMEYLEGEDLAARLYREHRLPIEHAVELVLQTCEVLAEAHALGIVHRDLKPANLFCLRGPDGAVSIKVLDFGISKLVGPNTAHTVTITKTSTLVGSPTYMSPEQIQSPRNVDGRTDIWAIGIVLYELLAGKTPFDGDSTLEICSKVAKRRPPPIRRFRPETPPALEAAILRCLEKDRTKRFSSVAELSSALAPFATDQARRSIDRISQFTRSGKSTVSGSIFPVERAQGASPRRGRPSPWTIAAWSTERFRWTGWKGAAAAIGFGLTGIVLISADLLFSKRSTPSPAFVAPLIARSGTSALAATPGSTQLPTTVPLPSSAEPRIAPQQTIDCLIDFNSAPNSTIVLDGRKIGMTPKLGFATYPGTHVVVFQHPVHGRLTTSIDCKAGETKAVTVQLGRPTDASGSQANRK